MKQLVSVIAVAISLLIGASAMARDGDGRGFDRGHSYGHDYRGRGSYGDRKFFRRDDYGGRYYGRRYYDRYRPNYYGRRYYDRRYYDRKYDGGRFYRDSYSYRSWRRGDRLSGAYFSTRFVVNDFGSYGLYSPPRGYRWHRVGRDAFLVGVATGVIIGIAADSF